MNYSQIIAFDTSKGGTTPNLCLDNVRKGYGIGNKYGSAWLAWQHTQQHIDPVPAGLDVPLFYSYTATIGGITDNYGHINVRLKNGTVWSDGNIYASIADYEFKKLPRYVGWGESVNDFKIIGGSGMQLTPTQVDKLIKMSLGRASTPAELNNPDYQKNAALLTETLWNNGGEARYNSNQTPAGVKPYDGPPLFVKA